MGAIALSYSPQGQGQGYGQRLAAFLHDESSEAKGGGGYESAIAPLRCIEKDREIALVQIDGSCYKVIDYSVL